MNFILLFLFFILLILHRFLSVFWEQGNMPYNFGFAMFYQIFMLSTLILFVHMWGWIIGIVLTLLTLFQILFLIYVRPILFLILRWYTTPDKLEIQSSSVKIKYDKFAWIMQNVWSNLVPLYFVLTIISLFTCKYLCGYDLIKIVGLKTFIIATVVYMIVGQVVIFAFSINKNNTM